MTSDEILEGAGAKAAIVAAGLDLQLPRLRDAAKTLATAENAPPTVSELVAEALERLEAARGLLERAAKSWPAMQPD